MQNKTFVLAVSLFNLFSNIKAFGQVQTQEPKFVEGDAIVRVKSDKVPDVRKALSKNGVYIDEFSQVVTHQEQSYIDIKCFNCIINNKHFTDYIQHSDNDIVTTKKYDKDSKVSNNSWK